MQLGDSDNGYSNDRQAECPEAGQYTSRLFSYFVDISYKYVAIVGVESANKLLTMPDVFLLGRWV